MSTTVTYKGSVIATVSNAVKKLLTKGKYLEDDITITDSGGGGSAVLETLQVSYTPSETAISDTQTPSQGYDGFDEAQISVAAIPSSYVGSGVSRQAAQTIHPSTSDQTIAADKYLSGTQTIKGVLLTNLTAENIKKDVVVEVGDATDSDCVTSVTGTFEGALPYFKSVATASSRSTTLSFPVGDYELPSKYVMFIDSNITIADPNNADLIHVTYIKATKEKRVGTGTYMRGVTTLNTNGSESYYTSRSLTISKSGTNLSVKVASSYYRQGATYTLYVYDVASDI